MYIQTVQVPQRIFVIDELKLGELYTIVTEDGWQEVSALAYASHSKVEFENGRVITPEDVSARRVHFSPTESMINKWIVVYGEELTICMVEGTTKEEALENFFKSTGQTSLFGEPISMSDFRDEHGYFQSGKSIQLKKEQ